MPYFGLILALIMPESCQILDGFLAFMYSVHYIVTHSARNNIAVEGRLQLSGLKMWWERVDFYGS